MPAEPHNPAHRNAIVGGGELAGLVRGFEWSSTGLGPIDAMRRGGALKIRARSVTHWKTGKRGVRIPFADNGHGMSAATKAQLYKPFFTTKADTGTGLGLWISEDIVRRHHGSIRLRSSESDGSSGTTFSLLFPLDETQVAGVPFEERPTLSSCLCTPIS